MYGRRGKKLKLYAAKVCEIEQVEQTQLLDLLDCDRKKNIAIFQGKKQREQSMVAGLLLRYAFLQAGYNVNQWQQVEIERTTHGKPHIKGYEAFEYSLSHSGEWVLCAVDSQPVGADIQETKPWKIQVAKRFYDQEEYDRLLRIQEDSAKTELFYNMWTAKESAAKRSGRGLGGGISRYRTKEDYQELYDTEIQKQFHIRLYKELTDYIVCVCSETADFPKRIEVVYSSALWYDNKGG